jgi:outer membrane protein assembly factor BamE (lipoprotein component of BamABCDE complex)|tara:strand:+ start:208 stop:660 length:453 start_codon:yes stop_codon:yes gene_type:complete
MRAVKHIIFYLIVVLSLSACKTVEDHVRAIRSDDTDKVTVGKVQAEIKTGMSGAEVAAILGSPNIVTTDEERREVWIYDKFATESIHSSSSGGVSVLFLSLIGNFAVGGANPSYKNSSGASSKSQRTMTIIIKYDDQKKVRDFAYHSSSF